MTEDAVLSAIATATSDSPGPELWTASLDAEVVGAALVERRASENAHLAELEINVLPGYRRRGIGRSLASALFDDLTRTGHTTWLGEVHGQAQDHTSAALDFAHSLGFRTVHEEDHLVLELPAELPAAPLDPDYDVLTWIDRCPDDLLDAYCVMRTQMNADVPSGELDLVPEVRTREQQRRSEERMAASYVTVVAAARRRGDGVLGGYTMMFLPHGETHVWQDDTLVMPEHRGRGLGGALKAATLGLVQRDHLDRTVIHTWTAPDNHPMQVVNRTFGFRVVERMHEVQRGGRVHAD